MFTRYLHNYLFTLIIYIRRHSTSCSISQRLAESLVNFFTLFRRPVAMLDDQGNKGTN